MESAIIIFAANSLVVGLWVAVLALMVFAAVRYRKELLGFGHKIKTFLEEVYVELRKSSWPTWIELRDSTIVVIIAVAALAVFVAIADWVFITIIMWLTKRG